MQFVEQLESRQMLSSAINSVVISGSSDYRTLRITGSDKVDKINVSLVGNADGTMNVRIKMNNQLKASNNLSLSSISIDARGGADVVMFTAKNFSSGTKPWVWVNGGLGNDTMTLVVEEDTVRGQMDGGRGNDILKKKIAAVESETEDILVIDYNNTNHPFGVYGGTGNDTIYGSDGDDQLIGGSGNDVIFGGDGDDQINGDAGNDWLHGGSDNDNIYGDDGDDAIFGDSGENYLNGGAGKNVVTIGEAGYANIHPQGDDIVYGSAEDDGVHFNSVTSRATFYGGDGEDYVSRPIGSTVVLDSVENDYVYDPNNNGGGKG